MMILFVAQAKHHVTQQEMDDATLEVETNADTTLEGTQPVLCVLEVLHVKVPL